MVFDNLLFFASEEVRLVGQFNFPLIYNLVATFLFALTGVILATKRGYDLIGVGIMALISGAGGGLIRDGIFLQNGPVLFIQSPYFILAVFYAILLGSFAYHVIKKFNVIFFTADALGLGIYGIIGAQMSLNLGLGVMAATIVGFSSAVGGGMIRDVLCTESPMVLSREIYATACIAGGFAYFIMRFFSLADNAAVIISILIIIIIRIISIKMNLSLPKRKNA